MTIATCPRPFINRYW